MLPWRKHRLRLLVLRKRSRWRLLSTLYYGFIASLKNLPKPSSPEKSTLSLRRRVLEDCGEEIAAMYDVYVDLYSSFDDSHLGSVYGLDTPVELRLNIPEGYREAPEGYKRIFTIICGHMDVNEVSTATRLETTRDGDDVVTENDKFSAFAVVYKDVLASPDTGIMTRRGGSAMVATVTTSVVIGVIVSILSFTKLIKMRREGDE